MLCGRFLGWKLGVVQDISQTETKPFTCEGLSYIATQSPPCACLLISHDHSGCKWTLNRCASVFKSWLSGLRSQSYVYPRPINVWSRSSKIIRCNVWRNWCNAVQWLRSLPISLSRYSWHLQISCPATLVL